MPLFIGGGVIGVVLIGLLVFLGIRALGGDDEPEAGPETTNTQPTDAPESPGEDPTSAPPGELGNATGQAKTATEKLQGSGYQCSDLFNGAQGAHRGCFKYDGPTQAEAVFQFQSDGTIIGVILKSDDSENVNNAAVTFDAALQAVGNDAFGGSEVAKVQQAVKSGQKEQKIGSTWGEFELRNDGERLQLAGGKSGSDSFELPRKEFQTTAAQLQAALRAKKYDCQVLCRKKIGEYGSQSISGIGSSGGIRILSARVSGNASEAKPAYPAVLGDAFGAVKSPDQAALKAWFDARKDGKSYAGYVAGWRVEVTARNSSSDYLSMEAEIGYESFYV
ncbi:hypothetical protein FB561_6805 [Kribbella amoyensis]|uniref:Uncharacterized protein n=2 Tax=Kribbella amoyensis TaxID=996641 RepID=A0A561B9B7_9ACTN|nr:hypothetical protein FB561_6805 [Kribbella amoyensis]